MPDPSLLRRALAAVVTVLVPGLVAVLVAGVAASAGVGASAQGARAAVVETDPLLVHLDDLTPVARQGRTVDISGTVTNTTDEPWTRVNLHAFVSESPILDAPQLGASAETDPSAFVGPRVTEPGTFDTVDVLEPGQTEVFSLSVPVSTLGIDASAGVYWIGVHAIGDSSVPRDGSADGKARTFIPFVPRSKDTVPVSVALPFRGSVWYSPDGRLARTQRWGRQLSPGGKYHALLDAAVETGSTPHTLLVDPAILAAISRLTTGNPSRTLAPDPDVPGQQPPPEPEGEASTPTTTASPPVATITPPTPDDELSDKELALAELARTWMARFLEAARTRDVLALPFGDLDLSAAARFAPDRYAQATERSRAVMEALGLTYRPVVAPSSSLLSPEALAAVAPGTTIMLGDTAFAVPPEARSSMVRLLGHRVLVTSTGAAAGGPTPTPTRDPLAMRQRLLSEAALHLDGSGAGRRGQPLVLLLPPSWRPEGSGTLLEALDQPWIEPVTITDLSQAPALGVPAQSLVYTDEDALAELNAGNFTQAEDLTGAGALMEEVLTFQTTIEQQVADEALSTLSVQHRSHPEAVAQSAAALEDDLRDQLGLIRVQTPKAVTLSSDSGPLGPTLINDLDQPVTVSLQAETDGEITLSGTGPRQLAPGSRTLARLEASTTRPGVHTVRLYVSSTDGTPLGSSAELPIRAAQVSGLIWLAMAVGGGLLFGAIGLRLWRRVRRVRAGAS